MINPVAYRIKRPPGMNIHDVFHVSLLEPWSPNTFPSREPDNPPAIDEIQGEAAWEVTAILDSKWVGRTKDLQHLEYFCSFKGYDSSENQWSPAQDFDDDDSLVVNFHFKYPLKPCTPQRLQYARLHGRSSGADPLVGGTVTAQGSRGPRVSG